MKVGIHLSWEKAGGGCVDLMMFNIISYKHESIITSVTEAHQVIKCFGETKYFSCFWTSITICTLKILQFYLKFYQICS